MTPPMPPTASRLRPASSAAMLIALTAASAFAGLADKLPPDPVENFAKALQLEKSDLLESRLEGPALKLAVEFRQKNLRAAAKELRSLSELAAALLLSNWPIEDTSAFDEKAREIDNDVRGDLLERFVKGIRDAFARGEPARQAAVAILLGETAVASATDVDRAGGDARAKRGPDAGRDNLFRELSKLTPDLAKLADSPAPVVRGAAARALGQFPRRPYTVAAALDSVLANDATVSNRREAAASLVTLVQTVTGAEPNLASEPGILSRETRRNKRLFDPKDRVAVWAAVIPVAARGLSDKDVRVRRSSASALQQAAAAVALEIYFATRDPQLKNFPPKERAKITPGERRRILEGQKGVQKFEDQMKPALAALTEARVGGGGTTRDALVDAAGDSDLQVRLGVRRTFDEMARARRFLSDLRVILPPPGPEPKGGDGDPEAIEPPKKDKDDKGEKKGKDDLSRAEASPLALTSGPALLPPPILAEAVQKEKDKDEKLERPKDDKKDDDKKKEDDKEEKKDEDADPYAKVKIDRDALGKALTSMGEEVLRRGAIDTNPAGRRASLEAVEALGETGKVFVPQLIRSLRDPDRFARWIAARILGKLAPVAAAEVVPALSCLLDEDDLDVRVAAIEALGYYNSSSSAVVPELAKRLCKGDTESRLAILRALENIGRASVASLPAVRPLLTMIDPRLRAEAARFVGLLARFGPEAREYQRDLQKLLNDPDSEVRRAASAALVAMTDR